MISTQFERILRYSVYLIHYSGAYGVKWIGSTQTLQTINLRQNRMYLFLMLIHFSNNSLYLENLISKLTQLYFRQYHTNKVSLLGALELLYYIFCYILPVFLQVQTLKYWNENCSFINKFMSYFKTWKCKMRDITHSVVVIYFVIVKKNKTFCLQLVKFPRNLDPRRQQSSSCSLKYSFLYKT